MLVTSYFDEYESDYTKYHIILLPNNEANINNIKLISEITNSNLINSRKMLMSEKEKLLFKNYTSNINIDNAHVIKNIADKLKKANINFKIIPNFPHKI